MEGRSGGGGCGEEVRGAKIGGRKTGRKKKWGGGGQDGKPGGEKSGGVVMTTDRVVIGLEKVAGAVETAMAAVYGYGSQGVEVGYAEDGSGITVLVLAPRGRLLVERATGDTVVGEDGKERVLKASEVSRAKVDERGLGKVMAKALEMAVQHGAKRAGFEGV